MIKAVLFDLFFTLVYPSYSDCNEYDVINITPLKWEEYAEEESLYLERALGKIKTEKEIIDRIAGKMPFQLTEFQKQEIVTRRENRMRKALIEVN